MLCKRQPGGGKTHTHTHWKCGFSVLFLSRFIFHEFYCLNTWMSHSQLHPCWCSSLPLLFSLCVSLLALSHPSISIAKLPLFILHSPSHLLPWPTGQWAKTQSVIAQHTHAHTQNKSILQLSQWLTCRVELALNKSSAFFKNEHTLYL